MNTSTMVSLTITGIKLAWSVVRKIFTWIRDACKHFVYINSRENPEIKDALAQAYSLAFRRLRNTDKEVHKFIKETPACQSDLTDRFHSYVTIRNSGLPSASEIAGHIRRYNPQAPKEEDLEKAMSNLLRFFSEETARHPKLLALHIVNQDRAVKEELRRVEEALGIDIDIRKITGTARIAAHAVTDRFKRTFKDHLEYILPNLISQKEPSASNLNEVISMAVGGCPILIKGAPGIGKTTILLILSEQSLKRSDLVPVYVSLSEWAISQKDIFEYLATRLQNTPAFKAAHMKALGEYGRLLLFIDGWNEIGGENLDRAYLMLDELQRDYPRIGLIVTTRAQSNSPSLDEPEILIARGFNEKQREGYVRSRISNPDVLLDEVRRNRELNEITRNPLYLSVLLSVHKVNLPVPKTKEELFSTFIAAHEIKPEHRPLSTRLNNHHTFYLTDLAVEMRERNVPSLSEVDAARIIAQTNSRIAATLSNYEVLSILASHHLLVHNGERNDGNYSFQHQQFQEWYASKYVENVIREALSDQKEAAKKELRIKIINLPQWEEALLFAVERISNGPHAEQALIASLIKLTLGIDPILSAQVIRRAGDNVWQLVQTDVCKFVQNWHKPNTPDRAFTFMLTSGRSDFCDEVWALFSNPDQEKRLTVLRLAQPFSCNVLGVGWQEKYKQLPENIRSDIGTQLAIYQATPEALDVALEMALSELSTNVKIEILESLEFRAATERVETILNSLSEEEFEFVANKGRLEKLPNAKLNDRLCKKKIELLNKLSHTDANYISLLFDLDRRGIDINTYLFDALENVDLKPEQAEFIFARAHELNPRRTSEVIVKRAFEDRYIGYHWSKYVTQATSENKKALFQKFLNNETLSNIQNKILAAILGVDEIKTSISRFLEIDDALKAVFPRPPDPALGSEYHRFRDLLQSVDFKTLTYVILEGNVTSYDHSRKLVRILAGHELFRSPDVGHTNLSPELTSKLRHQLFSLTEKILQTPNSRRGHVLDVVRLIGKIGDKSDIQFMKKLLDIELKRYGEDQEKLNNWIKNGQKGEKPIEAQNDYFNNYMGAFLNMVTVAPTEIEDLMLRYLSDPKFSIHAAAVLYGLYKHQSGKPDRIGNLGQFNFSKVKQRREEFSTTSQSTHPYVIKILDHIRELAKAPDITKNSYQIVRLAGFAACMEYGDRLNEILSAQSVSGSSRDKLFVFQNIILSGGVIPAAMILPIYDEIQQEWSKKGRPESERYFVEDWLAFLSLGEITDQVVERIIDFSKVIRAYWQMRDVLNALGQSNSSRALEVLKKLSELNPEFIDSPEWLNALSNLSTLGAAQFLLSILQDREKLSKLSFSQGRHTFPQVLAIAINSNPSIKEEVIAAICSPASPEARLILSETMEFIQDEEIMLASLQLISDNLTPPIPPKYHRVLERWVLRHVPTTPSSSSFYLVPHASTDVRKQLHKMTMANSNQQQSAKELLEWIDNLRDEYGRPENEPRHPDIDDGRPWPNL